MNACGGAEGIATKDGVVVRKGPAASVRGSTTILAQARKIVINPPHQFEIDQQLIERRIANALADSQGGTMDLVSATFDRCDRIDNSQAAVLMTVPIETHSFAL